MVMHDILWAIMPGWIAPRVSGRRFLLSVRVGDGDICQLCMPPMCALWAVMPLSVRVGDGDICQLCMSPVCALRAVMPLSVRVGDGDGVGIRKIVPVNQRYG